MPVEFHPSQTADGFKHLRVLISGTVNAADAEQLQKKLGRGGDHFGVPSLIITVGKADVTPEARSMFSNKGGDERLTRSAVVIESAPLRMAAKFMMRISGATDAQKLVASEAEGLEWIRAAPVSAQAGG